MERNILKIFWMSWHWSLYCTSKALRVYQLTHTCVQPYVYTNSHTHMYSLTCVPTHTHMCTALRVYQLTHTYVQPYVCNNSHTHVYSLMCVPTHTHMCTALRVYQLTHTCVQPYVCNNSHTRVQPYVCTNSHTRVQPYACANSHTCVQPYVCTNSHKYFLLSPRLKISPVPLHGKMCQFSPHLNKPINYSLPYAHKIALFPRHIPTVTLLTLPAFPRPTSNVYIDAVSHSVCIRNRQEDHSTMY
jgi:intracellular sulfur oxidation DsrE/DsrF family protein